MRNYLRRFKQGNGAMAANFIDYYREGQFIIKHEWSMGGETKTKVKSVPSKIDGHVEVKE